MLDRGRHLSYKRGKRNTYPNTRYEALMDMACVKYWNLTLDSLIKIEGVDDTKAAIFYLGKKIAYVYRAKKEIRGSRIRVIWGKVTRPHGSLPRIENLDCTKLTIRS